VSILIDAGAAGTFVSDDSTMIGSRPPDRSLAPIYRFLTITGGKLDYTHALLREEDDDAWYLEPITRAGGTWLANPENPLFPKPLHDPVRVFSGDHFKCGVVWFTVVVIPTAITWKLEQTPPVPCALREP
jgi:hypothetical protein